MEPKAVTPTLQLTIENVLAESKGSRLMTVLQTTKEGC
jgi:hypothetical protein